MAIGAPASRKSAKKRKTILTNRGAESRIYLRRVRSFSRVSFSNFRSSRSVSPLENTLARVPRLVLLSKRSSILILESCSI